METHRLLKTIGDETRIRILVLLSEIELNVTELETILTTSQSNVSRHLAKLLAVELVTSRRSHHNVYYCINKTAIDRWPFLRQLLNFEKNKPQGIADYKRYDELQASSAFSNPFSGSESHSDEYLI